jgi:hypothetical protein
VVEVKWDKTGYEPAFKNAKFWSNEVTGNNKTKSREGFFCLKIFCRCKKAGNLNQKTQVTIWSNQN